MSVHRYVPPVRRTTGMVGLSGILFTAKYPQEYRQYRRLSDREWILCLIRHFLTVASLAFRKDRPVWAAGQSLGRAIITIDDLASLVELLQSRHPDGCPPVIYFNYGHLDEPSDVKELRDDELASLGVYSQEVSIRLHRFRPVIFGENTDVVAAVVNHWLPFRQERVGVVRTISIQANLALAFVLAAILAYVMFDFHYNTKGAAEDLLFYVWLPVLIFLLFAILVRQTIRQYITIKPSTLVEYRDSTNDKLQHWRSLAVSAGQLIVALAIGIIGLALHR